MPFSGLIFLFFIKTTKIAGVVIYFLHLNISELGNQKLNFLKKCVIKLIPNTCVDNLKLFSLNEFLIYQYNISHNFKNMNKNQDKKLWGCEKKCAPLRTTSDHDPSTPELLYYRVIVVKFIEICRILRNSYFWNNNYFLL